MSKDLFAKIQMGFKLGLDMPVDYFCEVNKKNKDSIIFFAFLKLEHLMLIPFCQI